MDTLNYLAVSVSLSWVLTKHYNCKINRHYDRFIFNQSTEGSSMDIPSWRNSNTTAETFKVLSGSLGSWFSVRKPMLTQQPLKLSKAQEQQHPIGGGQEYQHLNQEHQNLEKIFCLSNKTEKSFRTKERYLKLFIRTCKL